jgi:hypothetical protein
MFSCGEKVMENRVNRMESDRLSPRLPTSGEECRGPQPIGAVLAELLAQYQARFPQVRITVVETPTAAI